uniref:V-SNARE coiled-coil homology domain-containing protein n=1 Tax=Mus spicilegus TaxID=10103 RepID=A0A8C6N316_MUSSI
MVQEETRVLHLDLTAARSRLTLLHWAELQSQPPQGHTSSNKATLPNSTTPYGPSIFKPPHGSNQRLQQTQNQAGEVVDITRKLSKLDGRADALLAGASQFETSAAKLKRKYWWKNCKMGVIGISALVIIVIIIIMWCVS